MRAARAARVFDGTIAEAERCWYDTSRWSQWIDGLDRVLSVQGDWPDAGATVTWQSGPAGRGRVTERVIAREPGGQTLEVEDASIRGRQSVVFTVVDSGVEVALTLEYELKRRSPIITALVDLLFIRRAIAASLETTVTHFGVELRASGH